MNEFDTPPENSPAIDFDEVISALLNENEIFPARFLSRFSDLIPEELDSLKSIWADIQDSRRIALMEDLEELAESNTLMFFENTFVYAMDDENSVVRQIAVRALWESDDKNIIPKLFELLDNDPEEIVQGQAALGLGYYIYLGEIGKIPEELLNKIVDKLILILDLKIDRRIKMKALESLGFSGDSRLPNLIEESYESEDEEWITSALVAMGRAADEQWHPHVMDKLDHANNQIRLEATKAAGSLEIISSETALLNLIQDEDDEIRMAAAWSLSEIGGDDAQSALEMLIEETEDEEELDLLQSAMDNLAFNDEMSDFTFLDIAPDEDEAGDQSQSFPDEG